MAETNKWDTFFHSSNA